MAAPQPVLSWILTTHAVAEMGRRGIDAGTVSSVLAAPEQRLMVRNGRDVLQSRILTVGKTYLLRVFVDIDRSPAEVVTVYRTSQIDKYWSAAP